MLNWSRAQHTAGHRMLAHPLSSLLLTGKHEIRQQPFNNEWVNDGGAFLTFECIQNSAIHIFTEGLIIDVH